MGRKGFVNASVLYRGKALAMDKREAFLITEMK